MIIILKILLIVLDLLSLFGIWFGIREYRIWFKSKETQELSVFEKVLVNLIALMFLLSLSFISISSFLILISKITVTLPY